ncbi:hypothetical protein RJ639_012013 [Escallonia herrerae]|uniref:Uncharacterized protein n=1 Tax=Escallonia herrerae TaxID=1293975 RepID=A0AA88VPA5_9ASTE|nr:hypothetical protein RJ639_012013 [Escallonia herrerae]
MQGSDDLSFCPSFNSYSSDRLAITAAKVTDELEEGYPPEASIDEDDDFEFSLVRGDPDASADEIVYDGQIRPIFPIFNRDLIGHGDEHQLRDEVKTGNGEVEATRIPLRNLFIGEREDNGPPSSSSSEADELESVPPGTYCVWRPKVAESVESSPSRCKKSSSTGSASKRWKFRDLLRRCNSEGKDSFVFLTPKNKEEKPEGGAKVEHPKERRNSVDYKVAGKAKAKGSAGSSAHEVFYVRNRAMKEGDKWKSYLPYRQDLVGFFANVNGLGKAAKAFPPFG